MSIKHILQAFDAKVGNSARKLVLIKLADNANDQGFCWPSHQHIADQCEMSKRSVINHISALQEAGLITVKKRKKETGGNHSNYYYLHLDGVKDMHQPLVKNLHGGSENSAPSPSENSAPITCHSLEPVKEPIGSSDDKPAEIPAKPKSQYTPEFEELWKNKPERQGANPKRKAFQAYTARLKDNSKPEEMMEGLQRYKKHLEEQQKLNTPFVMQMATFFGPDEHFKEQWTFNKPGTSSTRSMKEL